MEVENPSTELFASLRQRSTFDKNRSREWNVVMPCMSDFQSMWIFVLGVQVLHPDPDVIRKGQAAHRNCF